MSSPLAPGAIIGILGGGQLGQMLALAASRLGFMCHVYTDRPGSPASHVAAHVEVGDYDDQDKVKAFARGVDVLTYEFENVPALTAKSAENLTRLRPGAFALDVAQDRLTEKTFISETAKVPVTPFHPVDTLGDLRQAAEIMGLPLVLKTRRFGYDGKGQIIIRSEAEFGGGLDKLGGSSLIAEAFIAFRREVSVIAARGANRQTAAYPLIENVHKNHILHTSTAPAPNDTGEAQKQAIKIMTALDYVGVMATEFFEREDGSLLVNEIAPRVHNSGHWTQNAGCIDQFELHIRAIAGWPLGDTTPKHSVEMRNLIGDEINDWEIWAARPYTHLHLYGKKEARPGRKMAHINRIIG